MKHSWLVQCADPPQAHSLANFIVVILIYPLPCIRAPKAANY